MFVGDGKTRSLLEEAIKSENLEDSINEIKETLNTSKVTVVIGKDEKTNKL